MPKSKPPTFWGVRRTVWFGIAKWIGMVGAPLAALITALATAIKLLFN